MSHFEPTASGSRRSSALVYLPARESSQATFQAARRAERGLKVLELLGAGPDHPQRPEFPRSRYLKGALLAVD